MAAEVDVQFFTHTNNLALSDNWGSMIAVLDICLVNGLDLPVVSSATVNVDGELTLTFASDHKCILFQIVQLTGFLPSNINGKYRIKGVPATNKIVLTSALVGVTVSSIGTAKLPSLGYDKVFESTLKRVYRATNPTAAHPFIRVDETITEGANTYNTTYQKSAMVGLIENMTHIDDYQDPTKLQLPMDTSSLKKNWQIVGTGATVVRGWSRWVWSRGYDFRTSVGENNGASTGNRSFTIVGNKNAFYFPCGVNKDSVNLKKINAAGILNSSVDSSVIPPWFLGTLIYDGTASTVTTYASIEAATPLMFSFKCASVLVPNYDLTNRVSNHDLGNPIVFTYKSGNDNALNGNAISALEVPVYDSQLRLRGTLPHISYAGQSRTVGSDGAPIPLLAGNSMYIYDSIRYTSSTAGGVYYYLGEIE